MDGRSLGCMVTWEMLIGWGAAALAAFVVFGALAVIGCQYCRGPWRDERG
jgi:hypothetical protein